MCNNCCYHHFDKQVACWHLQLCWQVWWDKDSFPKPFYTQDRLNMAFSFLRCRIKKKSILTPTSVADTFARVWQGESLTLWTTSRHFFCIWLNMHALRVWLIPLQGIEARVTLDSSLWYPHSANPGAWAHLIQQISSLGNGHPLQSDLSLSYKGHNTHLLLFFKTTFFSPRSLFLSAFPHRLNKDVSSPPITSKIADPSE